MRGKSVIAVLAVVTLAGCAVHGPSRPQPQADDRTGAVVSNLWYTPGRALACGAGALLAGAVLTITFGQRYDTASELMHGGCSEPWTVGETDVRAGVP